MPRNGSNVYSKPAGTAAVPGELITSDQFNRTVDDLVADANLPRPVAAGGTGRATLEDFKGDLNIQASEIDFSPSGGLDGGADDVQSAIDNVAGEVANFFIGTRSFMGSGSFTYTPRNGTSRIKITMKGGGGGGGAALSSIIDHTSVGGGGASGQAIVAFVNIERPTYSVSVGSGGAGGGLVQSGTNISGAQAGGDTRFLSDGDGGQSCDILAFGGNPGGNTTNNDSRVASGGAIATGNASGASGTGVVESNVFFGEGGGSGWGIPQGQLTNAGIGVSGSGGGGYLGSGGRSSDTRTNQSGADGRIGRRGGGGSGAVSLDSNGGAVGGDGGDGFVIIEEYRF